MYFCHRKIFHAHSVCVCEQAKCIYLEYISLFACNERSYFLYATVCAPFVVSKYRASIDDCCWCSLMLFCSLADISLALMPFQRLFVCAHAYAVYPTSTSNLIYDDVLELRKKVTYAVTLNGMHCLIMCSYALHTAYASYTIAMRLNK